jgi:hypothetical protein
VAHSIAVLPEEAHESWLRRKRFSFELPGVLAFTMLGFLVMGYHPGLEDDGIYLAAVKADLNPALFPFNADFFRLQLEATQFDRWMASFIRWTQIPVAWAELLWQLAALFLILWSIKKIASRLFAEDSARWASVALVASMFSLPVAGTALYMADQHLHPRTLATAAILFAINFLFEKKWWQAGVLLLLAFLLHPLMTVFGISFCAFLIVSLHLSDRMRFSSWRVPAAFAVPMGWVFDPASPSWRHAMATRKYFYLYKWSWYEWLGAFGPLVFFWFVWQVSRKRDDRLLARFSLAVFAYGVFHLALAMVLLWPQELARITPLQPMRYLHLFYFLFALVGGGLLGKHVLKRTAWRWIAFLLIANGSLFAAQRVEFAGSRHLELPGRTPSNDWLEAFAWIKSNTPIDAYFALDPYYMEAPNEDYHSFPALAERSALADGVKDTAVVTLVPELAPKWEQQVKAQEGWRRFGPRDFERLKAQFGVNWVLVYATQTQGLDCKWHNRSLAVCSVP